MSDNNPTRAFYAASHVKDTNHSTRATHGFFLYIIIVVIVMGFLIFNNLYDDNLMF